MAIPNISDPNVVLTLAANVPVTLNVPVGAKTAVFRSTGNFYVANGATVSSSGSTATPGVASVQFTTPANDADETGLDVGSPAPAYTAILSVGGTNYTLMVFGDEATTFGDLVDALNADIDGSPLVGTWDLEDGMLIFTSTGTGGDVTIGLQDTEDDDTNPLFSSILDYAGITTQDGSHTQASLFIPEQTRLFGANQITLVSTTTPTIGVTFCMGA